MSQVTDLDEPPYRWYWHSNTTCLHTITLFSKNNMCTPSTFLLKMITKETRSVTCITGVVSHICILLRNFVCSNVDIQHILVNMFTKESGLFQVSNLHEPLHRCYLCHLHAYKYCIIWYVASGYPAHTCKHVYLFQVSDLYEPLHRCCLCHIFAIAQFGMKHVYTLYIIVNNRWVVTFRSCNLPSPLHQYSLYGFLTEPILQN